MVCNNTTECLLLVLLSMYGLGNQDTCRRTHKATSVITVPHVKLYKTKAFLPKVVTQTYNKKPGFKAVVL